LEKPSFLLGWLCIVVAQDHFSRSVEMKGRMMVDLSRTLAQLRQERSRTQKELDRLDGAISALGKLGARSAPARSSKPRARRKLSAAARKKISQAQKARWAKVRKQKAAA
jgi:hypothetical protein